MAAATLPRGPHGLSREAVARSQRRRLLDAVVAAVGERGYTSTVVGDVIARAGVSRTTFYEHFTGKEDCFLTAYREAAEDHYRRVVRAAAAAEPARRLRDGVRAYVRPLAGRPELARAFLVEVFAAGERALVLREQAQRRYVELLLRLAADSPAAVSEEEVLFGLTAALDELLVRRIRNGWLGDTGELCATATAMILAVIRLEEQG